MKPPGDDRPGTRVITSRETVLETPFFRLIGKRVGGDERGEPH